MESPKSVQPSKFVFKNNFEFVCQPLHLSAPLHTTGHHTYVDSSPIIVMSIPLVQIPPIPIPIVTPYQTSPPNLPLAMVARFTPLVLPAQLHDLPQGNSQRIKTFGGEGDITTQQHLDRC